MNRKELDAFTAHYGLAAEGVETALELTAARPTRAEATRFVVRLLHLAGILSLAAGVVFFVAANWGQLTVFGRFALVHVVLVAAVAVALWRPPPRAVGQYTLLLAFIVTGALFALFGQTYQTGADVYELFLDWALLGLPLVIAAQWSVVWAAWVLVINVALTLFCGARPEDGLFWVLFSPWELSRSQLLVVPLVVNVLLWAVTVSLEGSPLSRLAPTWLGRFAMALAVAYGTWGGVIVILGSERDGGVLGLLLPLVAFAAIAAVTVRRRLDVFPLAMIEGGMIVLGTTWLTKVGDLGEPGFLLVVVAWLIVSSTVSGRYLMRLVHAWGGEAAT